MSNPFAALSADEDFAKSICLLCTNLNHKLSSVKDTSEKELQEKGSFVKESLCPYSLILQSYIIELGLSAQNTLASSGNRSELKAATSPGV